MVLNRVVVKNLIAVKDTLVAVNYHSLQNNEKNYALEFPLNIKITKQGFRETKKVEKQCCKE